MGLCEFVRNKQMLTQSVIVQFRESYSDKAFRGLVFASYDKENKVASSMRRFRYLGLN